ncbi:Belongs to the GRAS [Dionaea muscipula]
MSAGYTGGGPDFFGGGTGGRATISNGLMGDDGGGQGGGGGIYRFQNQNNLLHQQQQLGGMGIDLSGQIGGHRRLDLGGKRSLAEFQSYPQIHLLQNQQQQAAIPLFQQQQQSLNLFQQQQFLRSVKPRIGNYHNHASTLSTLSPTPASSIISHLDSPPSSSPLSLFSSAATRYGVPVYQHLRPNPMTSLINNNLTTTAPNPSTQQQTASNAALNFVASGIGFSNLGPNRVLARDLKPESEPDCKILSTLQELEKQLLFDDDDEGEAVSVVTNSEWSVEFQKLVGPAQPLPPTALISPSPTSSSSSCSSSCSSSSSPPSAKQLISDAAVAIDEGKKEAAAEILSRLSQIASVKGNSEQRLAAYMAHALRSRAFPNDTSPPVMELCSREHMGFLYLLYDHSPCFKYGMYAANCVILETIASEKGKMIHVVDFDVGDGGQYVNLISAIADRQSQVGGGVVSIPLRVTAVNTDLSSSSGALDVARDRLLKMAEHAGVSLRFDVVDRPIHELTRESLGCEEEESVVVNFAFKLYRVPDESVSMENFRDELLRRVKGLRPRVVTLVEQEMNLNTAPFLTRVSEVSGYFGAVFESLETTKPRDDPDRLRMEETLGRSMANAVACEGRERLERSELFGKWRSRMGMAGFELRPLCKEVVESMQGKLNSARGGGGGGCAGLTVKEEGGGGVAFGWNSRTLTVASAWR